MRARRNHEGKKSNKERIEGTGTGLPQVEEQDGGNEDMRGLNGKETEVTDGEAVFSILQRS